MTIIDKINNEIIDIDDYMDAYREGKSRVKFHNSEFTYPNGKKHHSENAKMTVDGDRIIIRREE